MDKSILSKLIILLIAMTVFSSLLNSCNSKDKNSTGKLFSEKAHNITVSTSESSNGYLDTIHIKTQKEAPVTSYLISTPENLNMYILC